MALVKTTFKQGKRTTMSKVRGLLAKTKASNARFAKMTKAQKRVAIARDVIAALWNIH